MIIVFGARIANPRERIDWQKEEGAISQSRRTTITSHVAWSTSSTLRINGQNVTSVTSYNEDGTASHYQFNADGDLVSLKSENANGQISQIYGKELYDLPASNNGNLHGSLASSESLIFNDISDQKMYPGVKIYETNLLGDGKEYERGISINGPDGSVILVSPNSSLKLLQHEYGHFLDMYYGSGNTLPFLPKSANFNVLVGLPSLYNEVTGVGGIHKYFYSEIRANNFAVAWFGSSLAKDFSTSYPHTIPRR